jgi:hypothetical protein
MSFLVQGSAPNPYEVLFVKEGSNLTALCTCPAGENGQYCKHRFRILSGSAEGIVSDNSAEVKIVESWLSGTDIEIALKEVREAEAVFEKAEKELAKLKKKLARAMRS